MRILGIETSCDETAAAVVEDGTKVLSSVVASSEELHKETGGIIPENAARKQIEYIIPVVNKTLENAFPKSSTLKDQVSNIDAIAVTYGPGLIGSLLVGVETAKTLSHLWNKPLIPVNHLVAHIYANWLDNSKVYDTDKNSTSTSQTPLFPLLALVVSGGHTDLVLMKNHEVVEWIGGTRDDAAGEAFDKTARILGLPYPGGPSIAKEAQEFFDKRPTVKDQKLTLFPRPMITTDDFDWSFSGLKTSVLNYSKQEKNLDVSRTSAEIQEAIVDVLVSKTIKAIEFYQPKSFLLGGGVSANKRLREKFLSALRTCKMKTQFHVPAVQNCTDNAAVIASRAFFDKSTNWQNVSANPELSITD